MRFLLVAEFILAFSLPVIALAFGFFGTPIAIAGFFNGNFNGYFVPLLTVGGALGLWGTLQLLAKSLDSEIRLPPKIKIIVYLVCGFISVLPLIFTLLPNSLVLSAFSLFPIVVTLQLVFMHRDYFKN